MRDGEQRPALDPWELAVLHEIGRCLRDDDPELFRSLSSGLNHGDSWRCPWQWPATFFWAVGAALIVAGVMLAVASSFLMGLSCVGYAEYCRRHRNGTGSTAGPL